MFRLAGVYFSILNGEWKGIAEIEKPFQGAREGTKHVPWTPDTLVYVPLLA